MEFSYLKSYIIDRLENLSELTVYDGQLPDDDSAVFPCVSVEFPPLKGERERHGKDNIFMDLHFYDDSNNDTAVVAAAEKVRRGNGEHYGLDGSIQSEVEGFYQIDIEVQTTEIMENENNSTHYFQEYIIQLG